MKLNPFFNTQYKNWVHLESCINSLSTANERGEVFEQFVYLFLDLHRDYYQIKELYRFSDLPEAHRKRLSLENTDYGVDGVWMLTDGTYAAYQAKYRESRESATVRELATFWAEAERADHKYVIANAIDLPRQADKHGYSILVDTFEALSEDFFNNIYLVYQGQKPVKRSQYKPLEHQERMIGNILKGLEREDRGKLIAACGAGKTLVALWATEAMGSKNVIFLAPSLALIKQTLEAWSEQAQHKFSYLCVCSDKSVVSDVDPDNGDYDISEVDFPVTTDPQAVRRFMDMGSEYKYIFTTYNSAFVVSEALKGENFSFDLGIFDEAHRTAGNKETEMFSVALNDQGIKIEKRLFMTATERLVSPRIKNKAKEAQRIVFSMDDKKVYGSLLDRYSFGEAIKDNVISDYRIVLTAINKEEVLSLIQNNTLLTERGASTEQFVTAENIFKQIVLVKAMREFSLRKTISFHSSIKRARSFVSGHSAETFGLEDLMIKLWSELEGKKRYYASIDGGMPAGLRKKKLKEFEDSDFAVISNAKCLTEGVDVPIIDSIYFVDPKTSLIDIVQACGRALRKKGKSGGVAHFIVPVLLYPTDADLSQIDDGRFETLLNLVQALRDQDERLADVIDRINMHLVTKGQSGGTGELPLSLSIPQQFNLDAFSKEVVLRILGANSEPTNREEDEDFKVRRSSFRKLMKPIGDYRYETMFRELAIPTVGMFTNEDSIMKAADIRFQANNVSHSERLKLIEKVDGGYRLTETGKKLKLMAIDDQEVMRLAMLAYNCGDDGADLYPYRVLMEVLLSTNSLSYIEFLFGVYPLQNSSPSSIAEAIGVVNGIREKYPEIQAATRENKRRILDDLNASYGTNFSVAETWGSTTANNKFIYFRQHLSVFEGILAHEGAIVVVESAKSELIDILESSK
ncbi:MAG: DEAD/DEAH box helicase family protein [Candidatus Moraniibacteriota bacterium]